MRRKDKEITDNRMIEEILSKADILQLAMVDGNEPYIVTMNYAYMDHALWMHSAAVGRKVDILKRNNRVAFTVSTDVSVVLGDQSSHCTTHYKSVFGTGHCQFVTDREEKIKALIAIMDKHGGGGDYHFPEPVLEKTLLLRIDIDDISGKKSGV